MTETNAMERVADILEAMWQQVLEDRAEDERENRKGEWRTEWYATSPEKGAVRYKSQEAAYEGGRYWLERSDHPEEVEVYCQEVKAYPVEFIPREEWETRD